MKILSYQENQQEALAYQPVLLSGFVYKVVWFSVLYDVVVLFYPIAVLNRFGIVRY
jgi:hypothetical protein